MAFPASIGLRDFLKYCNEPEELTDVGRWAGFEDPGGGEQRSQRRMSISWQDFANNDGAEVDSFRQLPLFIPISSEIQDPKFDILDWCFGKGK